jgi:hypothetical protein
MRPGPGFHGSLANVDVSGDPSIDHIHIDKSARLHARAISEVLAVVKVHRIAAPNGPIPAAANPPAATLDEGSVKVAPVRGDFAKPAGVPAPQVNSSNAAINSTSSGNPPRESAPSLRGLKDMTRPKAIAPAELPDWAWATAYASSLAVYLSSHAPEALKAAAQETTNPMRDGRAIKNSGIYGA